MSRSTAHTQPRGLNGRGFAPADPVIADLADLNEDGTAMHLELQKFLALMEQADQEMDAVANEREDLHNEIARVREDVERIYRRSVALHRRERRANCLSDKVRAAALSLQAKALGTHREAGRVCCDAQAQRRAPKVHVEGTIHRLEVR